MSALHSLARPGRRIALVLSVALVPALSGCFARAAYTPPETPAEDLYRVTTDPSAAGKALAEVEWEEVFTDSALQALIGEAITANLDLQVATARIANAEANLLQGRGALFPSVSVQAFASQARLAATPSAASGFVARQFQLYASASWEADIWGKLTSAKKAALAGVLASEAFRRAVQTRLVADVAASYYSLLALDQQLLIAEKTVASRQAYEETVTLLKNSGVVTGADVEQSRANLYSAQVLIPDLKLQIREIENALSILLGRAPGEITRTTLDAQQPRKLLDTGVPALLLSNRPDVQQAELLLRSSFEMTNVARAFFYPALTLTGSTGLVSPSLTEFLNPASIFANIAAGLVQPIFNKNINRARLRSSEAERAEAYAIYKKTLLTASAEVSDALYGYEMALEKIEVRYQQLDALEKAVEYSEELLKYGSANYVDVLTSQQNLLTAQLNQVQDHTQKLRAIVELYRALGGGWR